MRTQLVVIALAGCALAGAPDPVATAHRRVSWGWGCGGNCSVNISGESETTLGSNPSDVRVEDHGILTQRQDDPGGVLVLTTRWRSVFHGTGTAGTARREFDLRTEKGECTRTEETTSPGKPLTTKQTACAGPPTRWKLTCQRGRVQVEGHPRPAWVCSPSEPMSAFGTEFPWVFGVDSPITTVISGEPHPRTTYE